MNKNYFGLNKLIQYFVIFAIVIAISRATSFFLEESNQNEATTAVMEKSINSALMQCYALEGAYPADVYHLEEYGIWFDDDRYYYYYEYINGGIMPMITVVAKPS